MLHIDCGIDIDACMEQLFHILIPFEMPAAGSIAVRQLIHQNQLRTALQCRINIKFPQLNAPVLHGAGGQLFQSIQQCQRIRTGMPLDVSHHHIHALLLCQMGSFQHGICLADSRRISKEDLQPALPAFLLCLCIVHISHPSHSTLTPL